MRVSWGVAGVVLAVAGLVIVSSSTARHARAIHPHSGAGLLVPAPPVDRAAVGMDFTPAAFTVPWVGTFGFRCDDAFAVQPEFDTRGSPTEDLVTMRAGRLVRRNYTVKRLDHGFREIHMAPLGSTVALPFGQYRTVVVTVSEGTEARAITATLTATFIDGPVHRPGSLPGHACYVARWRVDMKVSPF